VHLFVISNAIPFLYMRKRRIIADKSKFDKI